METNTSLSSSFIGRRNFHYRINSGSMGNIIQKKRGDRGWPSWLEVILERE